MSTLNEAETRAKLIDPAIHARGWTEDLIKREESAGAVEIVAGKARRRARGRIDYTLRVRVNHGTHPVAPRALAGPPDLLPGRGLPQAEVAAE